MKVPVSWLKDFVDLSGLSVVELAHKLTMAGMEVEEIRFVGLPLPESDEHGFRVSGLSWDADKIVVAQIDEVFPHPNADRLVLCRLNDGLQEHTVLTGAPNLFEYKGLGPLPRPLKVAYAREGARIYDGHQPGQVLTTLKRAKIRGVESYSMVCSEKELGISEEHEGIILLEEDAPTGMPLAEYMGDAVLELKINPNMARNTSVLGVAREVAALTGRALKKPEFTLETTGDPIEGRVSIQITNPELNPRFTLALIRGVRLGDSPYWVQRRLRLAGMRPINNVVDATNYTMLEIGEPLHAFDYDVLVNRAGGKPVVILTRTARPGEKLTTLDGVERTLTETNVLVCDANGPLSLAGVMGGQESEVSDHTVNVLLEAAAWNFINIRRTVMQHGLPSEASYRFSRGVHPALAIDGLRRCLYWMARWSGGKVAPGIVDAYPLPPVDPCVEITAQDVARSLGISLSLDEVKALLERLEFRCERRGETLHVQTPPIRMDIGEGVVGVADLMEEIARLYGFERIPETRLADSLPPQRGNPSLEGEEHVRDVLVSLGFQEVITHRMTAPEIEARLFPAGAPAPQMEYVWLVNPISPEKRVLRRSLLASVLNVLERNARMAESLTLFEVGAVFEPSGEALPREPRRLAIAMTGQREESSWDSPESRLMDFYDLKGAIEALMEALHIRVAFVPEEHPTFHPGKCAAALCGEKKLGVFGELHPLVRENYEVDTPILAAEIDLETLLSLLPLMGHEVRPVSEFPPVLEDIAVVVDEAIPAARVEELIWQGGGKLLAGVRLFDVFRGEQLGAGKKSLAYSLTYQAPDRTLTDRDAAQIRTRIVRRLEQELGAKLRG